MPTAHVEKAHATALNGALIDLALGSAYFNARINLRGAELSTQGKWDEIIAQSGDIGSIFVSGDFIEAVFDVLPEGATMDAAFEGAQLPRRGTKFKAEGFGTVAIPIGPFTTSGINSSGSSPSPGANTQPWVFVSGTLSMTSEDKWTARWTMRRYFAISTTTAFVSYP